MRRLKLGIAIAYAAVAATLFSLWVSDMDHEHAEAGAQSGDRPLYARIEEQLLRYKLRYLLKTPRPNPEVVVVSFGWRAEKIYGPPPWPRDVYAAVIRKLRAAGAKTIVLDPLFADAQLRHLAPAAFQSLFPALPLTELHVVNPYNYVGELDGQLERAEANLAADVKAKEGAAARLVTFRAQREQLLKLVRGIAAGDASRAFERTIAGRRDVVFPSDYSNNPGISASSEAAVEAFGVQAALPRFSGQEAVKGYSRLQTLYPRLLDGQPLLGVNEVDRHQERFIRFVRSLIRVGDRVYPSTIVRALSHFVDEPIRVTPNARGFELRIGHLAAQLDSDGSYPLMHYNDATYPRSFSAIQLLRGKVPAADLAGKLVVLDVRTDHTATYLQYPTPLAQAMWASSIKATFASNLLEGHRGPTVYQRKESPIPWFEALAIWLFGGLFLLLALKTSLARALLWGVVLLAVALVSDWLLVTTARQWLALVLIGGEMGLLLLVTVGSHYLIQRLERQKVRRAFGFYLPKPVLEHMLRDEGALRLGGTRRELSILFTDIRGFTTLSERADPEALGEALNVHLTALTQTIFDRGGTLDKYMGDCVMAFFGAPLPQPSHPVQAVRAALQMRMELQRIQPVWREKCGCEVSIGVGVATGDVIVGNMGSRDLFDYTVVGDQVNLASRLEGLTKVYGVDVLVAEETMRRSQGQVAFLEVDVVRVKGKQEPVSIYEAICEGEPDAQRKAYNAACQRGIGAFRARRWDAALAAFAEALQRRPGAGLPQLYADRIATLRAVELPPDWAGVTEFTHK